MILAHASEPFADICRRLNLVPRLIAAQEWLLDGADRDEVVELLANLERELVKAIEQKDDYEELEEAA
jgi:hypothetical protein